MEKTLNLSAFETLDREQMMEVDGGYTFQCNGVTTHLSAKEFAAAAAYFGGTMAAALALSNPVGAATWAFIAATSAYAGR